MAKILQNMAQCKKCWEVIESKHRHDFVTCKCGAVSVDGGTDYLKRSGDPEHISELSTVEDVPEVQTRNPEEPLQYTFYVSGTVDIKVYFENERRYHDLMKEKITLALEDVFAEMGATSHDFRTHISYHIETKRSY